MRYSKLVECYEKLESTRKKLEKRDILAGFYGSCEEHDLYMVTLLSMGIVFPAGQLELGIAKEMIKRVIAKVTGARAEEVTKRFKETGDLGIAAEQMLRQKKQATLGKKDLTVQKVFENLRRLPEISGPGSQERKIALIAELLAAAEPKEARYIVRTVLAEMRIGVAWGIVRDALAKAFEQDPKEIEKTFDFVGDYGRVAQLAAEGKLKAEITVGKPIRVMLADRAPGLEEALAKFKNAAVQIKYDGFRIQCHRSEKDVKVFSRRMEDVTRQFPDIVKWVAENVKARNFVIEGEALAVGKKGRPLPFQVLSRRIQRKYDIEKMVKEIPVQVNIFDMLYLNGASYMNKPLSERWDALKKIIKETEHFRLADQIEPKSVQEANKFYARSLAMHQEGVIVKNLDAHYQPGKRVGYWLKVKQILEPLDLVVVGGEWGEGKRARWIGSLILAARLGSDFVETGRMASGLTEQQMEELTKKLKPLITEEHGKIVRVKPEIVVEVGYEEIQKSPKYPSGYALRFPRLLRIRETEDKGPKDANTVHDIEKFFGMQGRKK